MSLGNNFRISACSATAAFLCITQLRSLGLQPARIIVHGRAKTRLKHECCCYSSCHSALTSPRIGLKKLHVKRRQSSGQKKMKTARARLAGDSRDLRRPRTGTLTAGGNPSLSTQGIRTNLSRGDARRGPCPGLAVSSRLAREPQDPPVGGSGARRRPLNQSSGSGPGRGGRARAGASQLGLPLSRGPGRPSLSRSPQQRSRAARRPTQQVPANAHRCPAPPPCPTAAAVAAESRVPRMDKCRACGGWRPDLPTPQSSRTYQPAWQCASPRAFNAELLAAERRRGPTASPAAAPALPLLDPRPAPPCPALRTGLRPVVHAPGARGFRLASRRQLALTPARQGRSSGGVGKTTLRPANQITPVWVGLHFTLPLRNSAWDGLSVMEVSAPARGGMGRDKQAPGHNWPGRLPVTMETRPEVATAQSPCTGFGV